MSNNTSDQANHDIETNQGNPRSLSPADFEVASILVAMSRGGPNSTAGEKRAATTSELEAAHILMPLSQSDLNRVDNHEEEVSASNMETAQALVALSRSGAIRTAVHGRAVSKVLVWDVRTKRMRLDSTDENIREVNPFRGPHASDLSDEARSNSSSELAERLWSISLMHIDPPQIELEAERITSDLYSLPPIIHCGRCPDVPEQVGCFVDMWDVAGYTLDMVLDMLLHNNIIVPREYLVRRLGLQNGVSLVPTPQEPVVDQWVPDDEFMGEDDLDEDPRDEWEDDLELWYEEH
jgi:hypothetical protein